MATSFEGISGTRAIGHQSLVNRRCASACAILGANLSNRPVARKFIGDLPRHRQRHERHLAGGAGAGDPERFKFCNTRRAGAHINVDRQC